MNSFNLSDIATRLESLEETIIFRLIDRVQVAQNSAIYESGKFPLGESNSLLDHMFRFHEETMAVLGRYTIAEERPFFSNLPQPAEGMESSREENLAIESLDMINLTSEIRSAYSSLIEKTTSGDDGEYGTAAELDISTLQAVARRIHFGSFYVAESKFLGNPEQYSELIRAKDSDALMQLLTRQEVEDRIIERIKNKCHSIQASSNLEVRKELSPDIVANFYFDTIIPLTKVGEITYLLNRDLKK